MRRMDKGCISNISLKKWAMTGLAVMCALVLTLLVPAFTIRSTADSSDDEEVSTVGELYEFSGTRKISFTAEPSDINNFISGGRSALDIILRSTSPSWLSYSLTTEDDLLALTFEISFDSFEDYEQKLEEMLLTTPDIAYFNYNEFILIEGHCAYDLLAFLENTLNSYDGLSEKTIEELFALKESSLTLGDNTWSFDDKVYIKEGTEEAVSAEMVYIDTELDATGTYTRKIQAALDANASSDIEALKKQFSAVGNTNSEENDGYQWVSITFTAENEDELLSKTLRCFNTGGSISEIETYDEEAGICTEYAETLDANTILKEGGTLKYTMTLPSYACDITSEDKSVNVDGHTVTLKYTYSATDDSTSLYSFFDMNVTYNIDPYFSKLTVYTDFTNIFGKITRTITFEMPIEMAKLYGDSIKDTMTASLIDGVTLDIYDESDVRCYRFTFSAWFLDDVREFTQAILGVGNDLRYEQSWIPFGGGNISDYISVAGVAKDMSDVEKIEMAYKVSVLNSFSESTVGKRSSSSSGRIVSFTVDNKSSISMKYTGLNTVKTFLLLIIIIVLLIVVLKIIFTIRDLIKRRKSDRNGV